MSRLSSGGLIDRSRPLSFTFDGRAMTGFTGDTLASALVANDVRLVGRSFKYHRPRGILTAGAEEPNALVTLRSGARAEPNSRATTVELFDGLEASSQNRWPSLSFDLMAVNQIAAPLFVAGFYYKTFMWPAKLWERLYEPLIRRAAGLGALSGEPDPDSYDKGFAFCDLLVIGGGPAGLAAALTAGRAGLRVMLADDDHCFGGRLLAERHEVDGMAGHEWAAVATAELAALPNVTLMPRSTVFGVYDGREYGIVERVADHLPAPGEGQPRQRLWRVIASQALLASGAIERPITFGGNDRPGVMMAGAVSAYVNRFAAAPGRRAVVFTSGDSGWRVAEDLLAAGVELLAIVDARTVLSAPSPAIVAAGVEIVAGGRVTDTRGSPLHSVEVIDSRGHRRRFAADLLAVSGGWNPTIGLGSHLGGKPVWSDAIHAFVPGAMPQGLRAVGAASGALSLGSAIAEGHAAAADVVAQSRRTPAPSLAIRTSDDPASTGALFHVPERRTKAFVDFQHDVTDEDVALAAREGFASIEHMKRYTTLGMATDQGKTSQIGGHALLAAATGRSIAEAGTILSRPPWLPVAIGALAGPHRGEHFRPVRKTASHDWAAANGATFVDAGQWKRAQWFARPGETHWRQSVDREVKAVRESVGICDVSTLGKIDVHGPDAAALLDRLYINLFSTLPVGKARYGVMLREDGFVMDDGTTTRFADDRFFLTTTTANAARVMQHIDHARQVIWPDLDVTATSVTEQWATYAVAGPRSRALMQALLPAADLSNDGFPYMAAAELRWQGMPLRLFRLSFSGELAYEVSVPAKGGMLLLRALIAAGEPLGAQPYGTEALGVLRIEKGHAAGNELNGQTTAADLGMGRMMSKKKDFIGRVMAARPALADPARPRLVGLRAVDAAATLRAGAHLLAPRAAPVAANDEGYVTSAAWSPTLGCAIALGLLRHGAERHGEEIILHDPVRGPDVRAIVCDPVFVDPQGERVRG